MIEKKIQLIPQKGNYKIMTNLLKKIVENKKIFKPVIYGIEGINLTDQEKYFFSKNSCLGFILFARNIVDKTQLKNLTDSLRELMDGEVLILIDQEGGRVARLAPPVWQTYPTGEYFAEIYQKNKSEAITKLKENFTNIANDLVEVGINVNCAPVLDVLSQETHHVISNRAYGSDPIQVAELGLAVCQGLLSKNVFPVIKHIPGHGRGACDSHLELPKVNCSLTELIKKDFYPFKALNDQKFAMTAHILYQAIDSEKCATVSSKVINIIRDEIGFKNILMTDDLSMKALKSSFADRTKNAIDSGCDIILHCNSKMDEMLEISQSLKTFDENFKVKFCK
jgi:beta-N-acetylhexosaminidase